MLAFSYWFAEPYLTYHVIDATGKLVRSEPITMPALGDDARLRGHPRATCSSSTCRSCSTSRRSRSRSAGTTTHGARVGVMPRDGGDADVRWFDVDPCYVFHPMNAFDDGDTVVVDVAAPPDDVQAQQRRPERRRRADARPVDDRPLRGQGARGAHRRAGPGVPARQRDVARITPPLRLRGRRRTRRTPSTARRYLKHDFVAGASEEHDFGAGPHARASSCSCRAKRRRAKTTAG